MKLHARLIVSALTLFSLVPGALSAQVRDQASLARLRDSVAAAGGRIIITFKSASGQAFLRAPGTPPIADSEMDQIQGRMQRAHRALGLKGRLRIIGAMTATADAATLAELNTDPDVAAVEADTPYFLTEKSAGVMIPRDALATSQDLPWGITQVTAPAAWAAGFRGDGVTVGMMDSGGDPTHPDLSFAGGYNAVTGGTTSADWADNVASCNGHGTHVAGTVAAKDNGIGVVGVAPNVTLYALKVFQDISGSCGAFTSSQILALQWAVTNHIRVVSASIGGGWSGSYSNAVDQAAAAGTYLVAAAGNDNGGAVEYPGAYPSAIAVSSLSTANTVSSFSSVGPQVFVGAPGENVESTMPGGTYGYKSGTSMATPHVAGIVALLLEQTPTLTLAQLKQKLQSGALDIDASGFDNNTGWGLARAANSLGTSGNTPVTLAVSPSARSASVVQGGTVAGDNATVTLAGTNASTTTWTATHKKSWTTLTTASGTGSGTLAWTRSATGLAVGTYVDTLTVTASGVTSPSLVFDTLKVTAPIVQVTLAVSPAARSTSVTQGSAAPSDNATVTLAGTNAGGTTWSATKRHSWITLTSGSGTGSGTLAWSRSTTGLAVGTYVDTLTVTAADVASPATVYDTLKITATVIPVTLAVTPPARSVTVTQGSVAPADNATITLSGTNASTTVWTATNKGNWNMLTVGSGTGTGTLTWNRSATGLAVGTYVDTITVTAVGVAGSSRLVDTLKITAAPPPVTVAVSASARSVTMAPGTDVTADNVTFTLSGLNASTTTWTATTRHAWNTLYQASGVGSGTLSWYRRANGLAVGVYVDTITVVAGSSSAMVFDTLHIQAPQVPVTVAVTPLARSVSVQQGNAAPTDNATITLSGTNASTTAWTATKRRTWNTLTAASGTGSGTMTWSRSIAGLAVGTYVDTITVAAASAQAVLYDTLRVTAAPIPVTVALTPTSRTTAMQAGTSVSSDNVAVTLAGTDAATTSWTATHRQAWNTLSHGSGTGSGTLGWDRRANGLAVGTYVDTITVTAGTASAIFVDSVRITDAVVPVTVAVSPGARSASVVQGSAAPSDSAAVVINGTGSPTTAWVATHKAAWNSVTVSSGTGNGTVRWTRNATGLAAATYVDTITVSAASSSATLYDTLKVTAPPPLVPIVVALLPSSRSNSVQQGGTLAADNAAVVVTGTGASTTAWQATNHASWNVLTTASGTGPGTLAWTRLVSGLAAGVYVDTITVVAGTISARLLDTVQVTALSVPVTVAVSPVGRRTATVEGSSATLATAQVTLQGTAAATTTWSASNRRSWNSMYSGSGTGSGTLIWSRNAGVLAAGTYVDTITVLTSTGASATLFDTVVVASRASSIALAPGGRRSRMLTVTGVASVLAVNMDSAMVTTDSALADDSWLASTTTNRLQLTRASGAINTSVVWQRLVTNLTVGMHVDTVAVHLVRDSTVQALFIDSLEVVSVATPDPQSAVEELFRAGPLNDDQRTLLDKLGNNNGTYDLGDLLAWVDRTHAKLSANAVARLQEFMVKPPAITAGAVTKAAGSVPQQ
ncbi:MAG TPA: S8 family serine peptidase [Gemmatimonadales bacterium]